MTDWRQIQARIRKAKSSSDPPLKLSELFQRTHDAMVAWELGAVEEKAARAEEAVKWYTIASQRFRRAEWKKKAEEALARLGVAPQISNAGPIEDGTGAEATGEAFDQAPVTGIEEARSFVAVGEIVEMPVSDISAAPHSQGDGPTPAGSGKKRRRRGRRGVRGRHRAVSPLSSTPPTTQSAGEPIEHQAPQPPSPETRLTERPAPSPRVAEVPRSYQMETPEPQLPSERTAHGRAGDPALASRMAHLESMLRRLVASPLHRLDEADQAPAGPGVLLLSDSDQITSYYVEACQTLRVGVANLLRGGRSARNPRGKNVADGGGGLKEKLAEHLGIGESKVLQYMKNHCVIRWIQLDDDAPHLAHFAIGVLRTPLNLD